MLNRGSKNDPSVTENCRPAWFPFHAITLFSKSHLSLKLRYPHCLSLCLSADWTKCGCSLVVQQKPKQTANYCLHCGGLLTLLTQTSFLNIQADVISSSSLQPRPRLCVLSSIGSRCQNYCGLGITGKMRSTLKNACEVWMVVKTYIWMRCDT